MSNKKTHSLGIYLIKENLLTPQEALTNQDDCQMSEFKIDTQDFTLYYKQNPTHSPTWIKLFQPALTAELNNLKNSGTGALLFTTIESRIFAIPFGFGHFLLRPDSYEENFGLKVVLNVVDENKLRSIDTQTLEAVPLSVRSQSSKATEISDFGLDTDQDIMFSATGKPKDPALGGQVTGSHALKLRLPLVLEDLPILLNKVLNAFQATNYKTNFSWVDHLAEVKSRGLCDELNMQLIEKIRNRNFNKTWLAVPEIVEWSDIDYFRYVRKKRNTEDFNDICWEEYLTFIAEKANGLDINMLKDNDIFAFSSASEQPKYMWNVYRCIYCELEYQGSEYALNNGKWYKIDSDYLANLNQTINQINVNKVLLPDYNLANEGLYNESVVQQDTTKYALMDKKNIQHGGGQSKIEFCDLYTLDKKLIHVKNYGGSSVLSHLFSQGLVSASLFLSDKDFRVKVNKKLPPTHKIPTGKPIPSEYEVVYAIASRDHTGINDLPLFSKINLKRCHNQLELFGLNVSVTFIPKSQNNATTQSL